MVRIKCMFDRIILKLIVVLEIIVKYFNESYNFLEGNLSRFVIRVNIFKIERRYCMDGF